MLNYHPHNNEPVGCMMRCMDFSELKTKRDGDTVINKANGLADRNE